MLKHIFRCDTCGAERVWGVTDVRGSEVVEFGSGFIEVQHPLLMCENVRCKSHGHNTPHTFDRYDHAILSA